MHVFMYMFISLSLSLSLPVYLADTPGWNLISRQGPGRLTLASPNLARPVCVYHENYNIDIGESVLL